MIVIKTFSYRFQKPDDLADMVIDCRSLRNPYRDKRLRHLNGTDTEVKREVQKSPGFWQFFNRWVSRLVQGNREDTVLLVYVGCFGGKHRSVAIGEMLAECLRSKGFNVELDHTSPAMGG